MKYPLCPGKAEYVLGSPLFDRSPLHLAGDKTTVIEAHGQGSEAVYVSQVSVNGEAHVFPYLSHEAIVQGGQFGFFMQSSPASRASAAGHTGNS